MSSERVTQGKNAMVGAAPFTIVVLLDVPVYLAGLVPQISKPYISGSAVRGILDSNLTDASTKTEWDST